MARTSVDLIETLRQSFDDLRSNVVSTLAYGLIFVVGTALSAGLLGGYIAGAYLIFQRAQRRGESIQFWQSFVQSGSATFFFGVFWALGVALGTVAFVLPGALFGFLSASALVDVSLEQRPVKQAFKRSWKRTRDDAAQSLVVGLLVLSLNVLGCLSVVGLIFTVPWSLSFLERVVVQSDGHSPATPNSEKAP